MPTTRLAALLFVDLHGFGALVLQDEREALARLGRYRSISEPIFVEHGAEVLDRTNDEYLALFDSATAAVQCALHVALALRGGPEPLPFRCGIHLGDVWREEGRVIGNGVNTAARVKQAAGAGEILLSEDVWRQVSNKLAMTAVPLRGRELKNIEREMVLYRVTEAADGLPSAPTTPNLGPGPRGPSLAGPPPFPPFPVPPLAHAPARPPIVIDPGAAPLPGLPAHAGDGAERRLDVIAARRAKAVGKSLAALVAGGALGLLAWRMDSLWLWAATVIFGLLPLASGVRKAFEAGDELARAEKRRRRPG